MSRMKHIKRWALMRNTWQEDIAQHSLQVSMIAHALALLRNRRFGGGADPERAALLALYHEAPEVITGDLATPIKYFNPGIRSAYKEIEGIAARKLHSMLPEDLQGDYAHLLLTPESDPEWPRVKAADKIAAYIAENVTANVRQLEGTINKIMAYKDLLGNDTDEETVTRAIQDMLRRNNEYIPSPEAILEYISKFYSLDEAVIRGQQRIRDAVQARQIAMYLIRSMTNLSLDDIGKQFDNRDHSTVLYSIQQVEKKMKKDAAFAETVKEIKTNINSKR